MEFEKKVLSREIQQYLYESGLTVGSAESCTGGRIAEAIIAVPGASTYLLHQRSKGESAWSRPSAS